MVKYKQILKEQFGIESNEIIEVYGGNDDKNTHYRVTTNSNTFFLKVYDKNKVQTSQWIENIDTYIPILV